MGYRAQIIVLDWRLNEIISRFVLQEELSRLLDERLSQVHAWNDARTSAACSGSLGCEPQLRIDFNPLDSDMMSGSSLNSFDIFLMRPAASFELPPWGSILFGCRNSLRRDLPVAEDGEKEQLESKEPRQHRVKARPRRGKRLTVATSIRLHIDPPTQSAEPGPGEQVCHSLLASCKESTTIFLGG